jgi:hypothetical protein
MPLFIMSAPSVHHHRTFGDIVESAPRPPRDAVASPFSGRDLVPDTLRVRRCARYLSHPYAPAHGVRHEKPPLCMGGSIVIPVVLLIRVFSPPC